MNRTLERVYFARLEKGTDFNPNSEQPGPQHRIYAPKLEPILKQLKQISRGAETRRLQ
ncbi:MAG: hypothetical protein QF609_11035 [Gammaproteobacteria bacterium]|nr:hypothetical protein [Gammaproteobacteria bacterium]